MKGAEIVIKSLIEAGAETIFGYPGGGIMPVFDAMYDYQKAVRQILVRHEQGAVHAAQGYARVSGKTGVVIVTSGPGATNIVTGVADAMIDSTPIVVITGQVSNAMLGTDAFQETDIIGLTIPISKWSYQIRRPEDIASSIAKAFYIASTGRPGPVVLDITKDAQIGECEFKYEKCDFIRTYIPEPEIVTEDIEKAAEMINASDKPFVVFGQGVVLSGAEKELVSFLTKGDIPCGATMLGLSALPSDFPLYFGMVGMHGNVAPNIKTNECDLLIAVGMRFDDRVTGDVSKYAKQAKIIHIDIDASEIGKIIPVDLGIVGNAKKVLASLTKKIKKGNHPEWIKSFDKCYQIERERVIQPEIHPALREPSVKINMGEVIDMVAKAGEGKAVIVTDVGQNQLMAARYSKFAQTRSMITSGGLGTMGFGLPAAIGAKIGAPERTVCLFVGDGGIQMTMQELGTIMQERVGVKVIILNNNWLGNVRQWQEMFFNERYSQTHMLNPDYIKIAEGYGIKGVRTASREELQKAVDEMFTNDDPYILDVNTVEMGMVMPMVAPGKALSEIMLTPTETFKECSDGK